MDGDGNPSTSVSVNDAGKISGVTLFTVEGGEITQLDSYSILDQDPPPAGEAGRQLPDFVPEDVVDDPLTPTVDETAVGLTEQAAKDLKDQLTSRTWMVEGNPAVSASISEIGEITSISPDGISRSGSRKKLINNNHTTRAAAAGR